MSDFGLTNPQETLLGHPVRSATPEPSVAGSSSGAGTVHLPRPPSWPAVAAESPSASRLASQGYGGCWRTEEVGGSPPLY